MPQDPLLDAPELPFTKLGAYDVLAPIAAGGMATVYLGRARAAGAPLVALKVIRAELARNAEFIAMFLDEATIASRLAHPSIVRILELGEDAGRHFLAMELLRGETLLAMWDACRKEGVRLPYAVIAWIGARIAEALHYAHELRDEKGEPQHVVHRDVNPSNIFITFAGEPKVIDFGLARAANRITVTGAGVVKGKLAYLSPEQTHGLPADRRADVFALGVTLWELSVDRRLFREESDVETVRRVLAGDVPDPRSIVEGYPDVLASVVLRALAREPDARYATADELARALDACVSELGGGVTAESVAKLLRGLFPADRPTSAWERAAAAVEAAPPRTSDPSDRIQAWDDQAQKMTWMHAAIESPNAAPRVATTPAEDRLDRLRARALALSTIPDEGPARARVHLELAIVDAVTGDGSKVAGHARDALSADAGLTVAHAVLRRAEHARDAARGLLVSIDAELAAATSDDERADALAERARLLGAAREDAATVRAAWERVLEVRPHHPAALGGLDAAYRAENRRDDREVAARRAAHLAHMAEAFAGEDRLAAWLQVERGEILDRELDDADGAAAAFARALELDPRLGPVRDVCMRYAERRRDAHARVTWLADEASREPDPSRAARLDLEAASVALHGQDDRARAVVLLERAAARAPTTPAVDRRVLDELVRLHEDAGNWAEARAARHARLRSAGGPQEARARAHELRLTAAIAERLGDVEGALIDVAQARAMDAEDVPLLELEDRLLAAAGANERRAALWRQVAAGAPNDAARADARVRAARVAESMGLTSQAADDLRAALAAVPAHAEALDGLARLLVERREGTVAGEAADGARERIEVYTHAAEHTGDPARRIAYLEASALLWEERLGQPALAAAVYDAILVLEPTRRGAVLGLARNAARVGDAPRLARALLAEAHATGDAARSADLTVRAATVLSAVDPEAARALVERVLASQPSHAAARAAEAELHARAGRWELVLRSLAARIEHTSEAVARASLWMARAEVQRLHLRSTAGALESLRAARASDPARPGVAEEIVALVEAAEDPAAARAAHIELARAAVAPEERARHFVAAGEIDEMVREDDAAAAESYRGAVDALPSEAWLRERLTRVLARTDAAVPGGELESLLESSAAAGDARAAFELARRWAARPADAGRALPIVEGILAAEPDRPDALRTLETIARVQGSVPLLANALAQEADVYRRDPPKLASMWGEAALVEWELPPSSATDLYERILERAPGDRAALDALLRRALRRLQEGDAGGRAAAIHALGGLLGVTSDARARAAYHLAMALVLDVTEPGPERTPGRTRAEALTHYRAALQLDSRSVTAALGAARLASLVGDAEAGVAAANACAELARDGAERAHFHVQAAGILLATKDARLGTADERRARAGELAERALEADPESVAAAGVLATVRAGDGQRDRHLEALRGALGRARSVDAVVLLGTEVARVAQSEPRVLVTAVDAMCRVREVAPGHVPSLRTLADLYALQRAWPESAAVLEAVVGAAGDPRTRRAALFDLADVYGVHLARPADVERVLRAALEIDAADARALRGLIAILRERDGLAERVELADLLARLLPAEPALEAKRDVALQLFEARAALGDRAAASLALVEAAALAPSGALLAKLAAFHGQSSGGGGPSEHARALQAVATRGQQLGRPDPAILAALGQLEVEVLGRFADAAAHLKAALALAPAMHEARALLALAFVESGAPSDATATLAGMMTPDAAPLLSLRDPGAALAVLERSLDGERRAEEATVARELRAIAGALDDATHVGLRARRLPHDAVARDGTLDPATLHARVLPRDGQAILLDVAAALDGIEPKLLRVELGDLGVSSRDRVPPSSGHPLRGPFDRLLRMLGIAEAELVVTDQIAFTRVLSLGVPWVVVPRALLAQPEPLQLAALGRALARVALRAPWIFDLPVPQLRAVLTAAARVGAPGYGASPRDTMLERELPDVERRVSRAIGRKQKKALLDLAPRLEASRGASEADVEGMVRAVARAELRVAFLVTGDLLATLDELRAIDADFARATAVVGTRALAATLTHPLAGDVSRFALTAEATALRRATGTAWGAPRGAP